MKSQLAALDLYYLIKELKCLIGSKVNKIYLPLKKQLIINFHTPNIGSQQLFIDVEETLYLTEFKFPTNEPSEFCMFLRKKLENSRLKDIEQLEFERIIKLVFESKESNFELILELFSRGNIILAKDSIILIAEEHQQWKDRVIKPNITYDYPKKEHNFLKITKDELNKLLKNTTKESLVKSLALDLGLGGIYAEELCLMSKLDKNKKPKDITEKELLSLNNAFKEIKNKKLTPQIVKDQNIIIDIVPFGLDYYKIYEKEESETFSKSLDNYFSNLAISLKFEKQKKKLDSVKNIIKKQEETIKELEKLEIENREKAEILYKKYELVSNILKEINLIKKKHSWEEIKEKLKDHKLVKEVNPKEKTILIEIS